MVDRKGRGFCSLMLCSDKTNFDTVKIFKSGFWSFYQLKIIPVWPKDWAGPEPVSSQESCETNQNFEPFKLLIVSFISTAHLSFWAHHSETLHCVHVCLNGDCCSGSVVLVLFWFCSEASCCPDVNVWSKLELFAAVVQCFCSLWVFLWAGSFPVCYQSCAVFIENFPRCCRINMTEVVSTPASGSPLLIGILGTVNRVDEDLI